MSEIDWDKVRRQRRVEENGSERSEFKDITTEIAFSKGIAKGKHHYQQRCPTCYNLFDSLEQHKCANSTRGKVVCKKCGKLIQKELLAHHRRTAHPSPRAVICRHCGKPLNPKELIKHLKSSHPKWRTQPPRRSKLVRCLRCGKVIPEQELSSHTAIEHYRSKP
jgi:phage FluMu protein Com